MLEKLNDRWAVIMVVVMWTVVIAVADMNWPDHMGGSEGGLIDNLLRLFV